MGAVLQRKDFTASRKLKEATLTGLGVVPVSLALGEERSSHSHSLIEEVIIVHKGKGKVQIANDVCKLRAGSVAVVPAGEFHALCNTGSKNLEATVVYNANVDRSKVDFKNREQHFGAQLPPVADLCREIETLKKACRKLNKKVG